MAKGASCTWRNPQTVWLVITIAVYTHGNFKEPGHLDLSENMLRSLKGPLSSDIKDIYVLCVCKHLCTITGHTATAQKQHNRVLNKGE